MSIDDLIKKYHKGTDYRKLEILMKLEEEERTEAIKRFLWEIIENEKYEKLRIKAILMLSEKQTKEITRKLGEMYAFERDQSVRLAIVQALKKSKVEIAKIVLERAVKTDESDKIRAVALANLHESKVATEEEMRKIIKGVLLEEKATFPKQVALSIVAEYADEEIIGVLKQAYEQEKGNKMKTLIYKTIEQIYNKKEESIDIEPPEKEEIEEEKGKKKRKGKKEKKKDNEELFFA